MGIRICPKCGGKVSSSRNDCIHCGYVFPITKKCPDCEEDVDISVAECPICGYPFVAQEKVEQPVLIEDNAEEKVVQESKEEQPLLAEEKVEEEKEEVDNSVQVEVIINDEPLNDGEKTTCPYCKSEELMPIGIDYYMCDVCKGKFLNTGKTTTFDSSFVPANNSQKSIEPNIKAEDSVVAPVVKPTPRPATQSLTAQIGQQPIKKPSTVYPTYSKNPPSKKKVLILSEKE